MKATFIRDYDYSVPGKPVLVAYKAGWSGTVPKAHYEAAVAAGAVVTDAKDEADAGRG